MLPSLVLGMCWILMPSCYSLFPLLIHTVPQNVGSSTKQLVDSNNTDVVKENTRQGGLFYIQGNKNRESSGHLVVRTLHSHFQGPRFNPWSGN